nr:acyl-protein thioesterase 1-like [Lytechinus pictus]
MSGLCASLVKLPSRIPSLVSFTSILVQIQPISSLLTNHQPIRNHHTSSPTYVQQNPASGACSGINCRREEGQSGNRPIRSRRNLNHPIGNQYMCGNSYSSMATPIIAPSAKHTATVIFLHGLGDTGHGWCQGFEEIKEPHIKYIFPNAPNAKVTLNFGMVMPSWFDIYSLTADGQEDTEGIKKASKNLLSLVEEEEKQGITADRIIIGGFSQGGGVSLYTAITDHRPYAGLLALSTWMPLHNTFQKEGVNKRSLPIIQCHGTADAVLSFKLGEMTHKFLKTQVNDPCFHKLSGLGHSSSMEEMNLVRDFIQKTLP